MDMQKRVGAEFFGTFWLTFAGCDSAVLAAGFPSLGTGFRLGYLQVRSVYG
jgi:aquaporin Z